jgi:hypothetical protein
MTSEGNVILSPSIGLKNANQSHYIRAQRDTAERITFTFKQEAAQSAQVKVNIMAITASDMVTMHASDGSSLTSHEGALDVYITEFDASLSVELQHAGCPLSVTDRRLDTNAHIDLPFSFTDGKLNVYIDGANMALGTRADQPLKTDDEGRLLVVLDADTMSIDISLGNCMTIYGSKGVPLMTDNSGRLMTCEYIPRVYQCNYIDVSIERLVASGSIRLGSLTVTNTAVRTMCYLRLYNVSDRFKIQDPGLEPVATYALFPYRREHLTWPNGITFSKGLGIVCTTGPTSNIYASTGMCMVHMTYTMFPCEGQK